MRGKRDTTFGQTFFPYRFSGRISRPLIFFLFADDQLFVLYTNFVLFVTASRSSSQYHSTNNLPPLLFHNVHGENIRISRDGTVAKRVESFCKGIAFSSRPVKVNEKVLLDYQNNAEQTKLTC